MNLIKAHLSFMLAICCISATATEYSIIIASEDLPIVKAEEINHESYAELDIKPIHIVSPHAYTYVDNIIDPTFQSLTRRLALLFLLEYACAFLLIK